MYIYVYELQQKCTQRKKSFKGLFSNTTTMNKMFLKDRMQYRKGITMQNSPSQVILLVMLQLLSRQSLDCLLHEELRAKLFGW